MKTYLIYCFVLFLMYFSPAASGEHTLLSAQGDKWDKETAEEKLRSADEIWLKTSPEEALVLYEELLDHLPEECEPFRSLIIMRLAQAHYTAGNKAKCLRTLDLLQKLDYVPEHHVLRAKELKAIISGKPHPGLQRTEIPPPRQSRNNNICEFCGGTGWGWKHYQSTQNPAGCCLAVQESQAGE